MERPGGRTVGSVPVITSLMEAGTVVKAHICMQRRAQRLRNILAMYEKNRVSNKGDESMALSEHPVEVFGNRRNDRMELKTRKHRHATAHTASEDKTVRQTGGI